MRTKHIYQLLVLSAFTLFIACSKKSDDAVAPDLATTAAGTYVINSITQSTTTVAVPSSANYTITLTRTNTNLVDMTIKTTATGGVTDIPLGGTSSDITFQKAYTTSTSTGNASGDIINGTITLTSVEGGITFKIVAKK